MAKKKGAAEAPARAPAKKNGQGEARVVGKTVMVDLASVRPNGWNPNKLLPHQVESIRQGFHEEGWLASQAMTIWGIDDKGKAQGLIIDGEHRWKIGKEEGLKRGPAVLLDGLTRAQAKKLTIKLDGRRGNFDAHELAALVADVKGLDPGTTALELGLLDVEMDALIASMSEAMPAPPPDFPEASETTVRTDHTCPKCGFKWSGKS